MTNERKIKVEGYFNVERELTKESYINRWVEQVSELVYLADEEDDFNLIFNIRETVKGLAGRKFERIFEDQQGE